MTVYLVTYAVPLMSTFFVAVFDQRDKAERWIAEKPQPERYHIYEVLDRSGE